MKTPKTLRYLAVAASVILASCGGGGGGESEGEGAATFGFWTMDSYQYQSGGNSSVSSTKFNTRTVTVAALSTATISGGDQSNGAYSGSSLTFSLNNAIAGVYTVTSDKAALSNEDATLPNLVVVESVLGIARTSGSTSYIGQSGTVRVTIDENGKYHFDTAGAVVPMAKQLDVLGGVAGAPAGMSLVVQDAR